MNSSVFDKDTVLDVTVNLVPIAIMVFFLGVFAVLNPWGDELSLERALQVGLVAVPIVLLALLTYVAAVRIEGDDGAERGGSEDGEDGEDGEGGH